MQLLFCFFNSETLVIVWKGTIFVAITVTKPHRTRLIAETMINE